MNNEQANTPEFTAKGALATLIQYGLDEPAARRIMRRARERGSAPLKKNVLVTYRPGTRRTGGSYTLKEIQVP